MNNNIDKLFLLIYNDEVVVIESNLTAFYTTIKSKEIDIGMGLTTLKKSYERYTQNIYSKFFKAKQVLLYSEIFER